MGNRHPYHAPFLSIFFDKSQHVSLSSENEKRITGGLILFMVYASSLVLMVSRKIEVVADG